MGIAVRECPTIAKDAGESAHKLVPAPLLLQSSGRARLGIKIISHPPVAALRTPASQITGPRTVVADVIANPA